MKFNPNEYKIRSDGDIDIKLTQGKVCIVSPDDYLLVRGYRWYALKDKSGDYYAEANVPIVRKGDKPKVIRINRFLIPGAEMVDHINGDTLDNRRSNIRGCTRSQNCINCKTNSKNISGVKGVHWHKQDRKWIARIKVNKKEVRLGAFDELSIAAMVRRQAEIKYYGEFARLPQLARTWLEEKEEKK